MNKSKKYTNTYNREPEEGKPYNIQRYTATGKPHKYKTLERDETTDKLVEVDHLFNYDGERKISYFSSLGKFTRYNYNPDGTYAGIINGDTSTGIYTERIYENGEEIRRVTHDPNTMEVTTRNMINGEIQIDHNPFSVIQYNPLYH